LSDVVLKEYNTESIEWNESVALSYSVVDQVALTENSNLDENIKVYPFRPKLYMK